MNNHKLNLDKTYLMDFYVKEGKQKVDIMIKNTYKRNYHEQRLKKLNKNINSLYNLQRKKKNYINSLCKRGREIYLDEIKKTQNKLNICKEKCSDIGRKINKLKKRDEYTRQFWYPKRNSIFYNYNYTLSYWISFEAFLFPCFLDKIKFGSRRENKYNAYLLKKKEEEDRQRMQERWKKEKENRIREEWASYESNKHKYTQEKQAQLIYERNHRTSNLYCGAHCGFCYNRSKF